MRLRKNREYEYHSVYIFGKNTNCKMELYVIYYRHRKEINEKEIPDGFG